MKHWAKYVLIVSFIVFIVGFCFASVFTNDQTFSEEENRTLAQRPAFTMERLLNGKFTKEFEAYINDQFFLRDMWTKVKANTEMVLLKKENNGIYFGKDGFLLEPFTEPTAQLEQNLQAIQRFISNNPTRNTYVLLAPTSIDVYPEKRPAFTDSYPQSMVVKEAQQAFGQAAQVIDATDGLTNHKEESIYFKTDHHWTMRGAFYAYQTTMEAMHITPLSLQDFAVRTVSDDFFGTHYTKAKNMTIQADTIELFETKMTPVEQIVYHDDETLNNSLYAWENLNKKDQYAFFLHGNHSLVTLKTNAPNNERIAVIKDSYAHALIPFLTYHYNEIHVIDLRYYHASIQTYLDEHAIQTVLFVYNIPNFANDTNMVWLR